MTLIWRRLMKNSGALFVLVLFGASTPSLAQTPIAYDSPLNQYVFVAKGMKETGLRDYVEQSLMLDYFRSYDDLSSEQYFEYYSWLSEQLDLTFSDALLLTQSDYDKYTTSLTYLSSLPEVVAPGSFGSRLSESIANLLNAHWAQQLNTPDHRAQGALLEQRYEYFQSYILNEGYVLSELWVLGNERSPRYKENISAAIDGIFGSLWDVSINQSGEEILQADVDLANNVLISRILEYVGPNGHLSADIDDLTEIVIEGFSEMGSSLRQAELLFYDTLAHLQDLLIYQGETLDIVRTIEAQQRWLLENEARKLELEQRQAEIRTALDSFQSFSYIMSRITAQYDPQLGKTLANVSSLTISFGETLIKTSTYSIGGQFIPAALSLGAGATKLIDGLYRGFLTGFQSDNEIIIAHLQMIEERLDTIREEMHDRFDRVDERLSQIFDLNVDIFQRLRQLDMNVAEVRNAIGDVQSSINHLTSENDRFFAEIMRMPYISAVDQCLSYSQRIGSPMPFNASSGFPNFAWCESNFYTHAMSTSQMTALSGVADMNVLDNVTAQTVLGDKSVYENLNFLAGIPALLTGAELPSLSGFQLPNFIDNSAAITSYTKLMLEYPVYGRQLASYRDQELRAAIGSVSQSLGRLSRSEIRPVPVQIEPELVESLAPAVVGSGGSLLARILSEREQATPGGIERAAPTDIGTPTIPSVVFGEISDYHDLSIEIATIPSDVYSTAQPERFGLVLYKHLIRNIETQIEGLKTVLDSLEEVFYSFNPEVDGFNIWRNVVPLEDATREKVRLHIQNRLSGYLPVCQNVTSLCSNPEGCLRLSDEVRNIVVEKFFRDPANDKILEDIMFSATYLSDSDPNLAGVDISFCVQPIARFRSNGCSRDPTIAAAVGASYNHQFGYEVRSTVNMSDQSFENDLVENASVTVGHRYCRASPSDERSALEFAIESQSDEPYEGRYDWDIDTETVDWLTRYENAPPQWNLERPEPGATYNVVQAYEEPTVLIYTLRGLINKHLLSLRKEFYELARAEAIEGGSNLLQQSRSLAGSVELLRQFVSLGFPLSVETDNMLIGLVSGLVPRFDSNLAIAHLYDLEIAEINERLDQWQIYQFAFMGEAIKARDKISAERELEAVYSIIESKATHLVDLKTDEYSILVGPLTVMLDYIDSLKERNIVLEAGHDVTVIDEEAGIEMSFGNVFQEGRIVAHKLDTVNEFTFQDKSFMIMRGGSGEILSRYEIVSNALFSDMDVCFVDEILEDGGEELKILQYSNLFDAASASGQSSDPSLELPHGWIFLNEIPSDEGGRICGNVVE